METNKEELAYKFTQEDLKFIQSLLPDIVQVLLKDDNTTMYTDIKKTKYIDSAIINFDWDFINEVEKYFSKIGKVTWNNVHSTWWIFY